MRKTSVKSLRFALGVILVLVVSNQSSFVHCRALRSTVDATAAVAAASVRGDESVGVGIANSFAVSSTNSSKRSSVRSLTYKLASGPSKRGTGH